MGKTIAILIAAHVLGDFLLQPDWMARQKRRFPFMFLHGFIHATLVYGIYQVWNGWLLPVTVLVSHLAIDLTKQKFATNSAKTFVWDQGAHVLFLIGIGWLFTRKGWMPVFSGNGYALLVGIAGFTAILMGVGHFVGQVAKTIKEKNKLEIDGLLNGGAMIGNLERALIFLLILIHQPAGIGFLVAAKSILRFQETKDQKLAEYVLIGTLLSFALAIAIATATQWAMHL